MSTAANPVTHGDYRLAMVDANGNPQFYLESDANGNALVSLNTPIAGEHTTNDWLEANEGWDYTIWDHADTSPVTLVGAPAIIGRIWCVEAFAGTPDPVLGDGASITLWTFNTGQALRDEILSMVGTKVVNDLRVTSTTAGTAGKLVIQHRTIG